jgi:hypothetical protein
LFDEKTLSLQGPAGRLSGLGGIVDDQDPHAARVAVPASTESP